VRPRHFQYDDSGLPPAAREAIAAWRRGLPAGVRTVVNDYRPINYGQIIHVPRYELLFSFYAQLGFRPAGANG
jgi:hypothetical protein